MPRKDIQIGLSAGVRHPVRATVHPVSCPWRNVVYACSPHFPTDLTFSLGAAVYSCYSSAGWAV
jgi:hypothetical protein